MADVVIERIGLWLAGAAVLVAAVSFGLWRFGEVRFADGVAHEARRQNAVIAELNRQIMSITDVATEAFSKASEERIRIVTEVAHDVVTVDRDVSARCDLPETARLRLSRIGGAK